MHILALPLRIAPGQFSGGSSLRVLDPLAACARLEPGLSVTVAESDDGAAYDLALIERSWREDVTIADARALVRGLRRRGIGIVHTLDDNLYDLFATGGGGPDRLSQLAVIAFFSRVADAVIVSTEALAEVARRFNSQVFVFPNHLAPELLGSAPAAGEPAADGVVRVGYMGTLTHLGDLRMVLAGVKAALHDEPRLRFEVVGVGDSGLIETLLSPYPVTVLRPPHHDYHTFMRWFVDEVRWDIGIAPLAEGVINHTKSDLKFLDYVASGAAAILADAQPYQWLRERPDLAVVVPASPEAWGEAIVGLARDGERRRQQNAAAWRYLQEERLLPAHVGQFLGFLVDTLAGLGAPGTARRTLVRV